MKKMVVFISLAFAAFAGPATAEPVTGKQLISAEPELQRVLTALQAQEQVITARRDASCPQLSADDGTRAACEASFAWSLSLIDAEVKHTLAQLAVKKMPDNERTQILAGAMSFQAQAAEVAGDNSFMLLVNLAFQPDQTQSPDKAK